MHIKGMDVNTRCNGNVGIFNSGDRNSGDYNSGNWNSGHCNSGDCNSGNWNSGHWNSGNWNSGHCNSGNWNSGHCNSGDWNSGDCNSGNWNSCNYSAGIFCSEDDENIRIFNKPSGMSFKDFLDSKYHRALCSAEFNLTEWVEYTEEEMDKDKRKAMRGGYLKRISYKEACAKWWSQMTEENKRIIQSMPNFDAKIFKDITGIDI